MLKYILTLSIMLCCVTTIYSQSKEPQINTASMSGTITLNGEPVIGAVITINIQSGIEDRNIKPQTAKTDQYGTFRITSIKAGQYGVTVSAPPFTLKSEAGTSGHTIRISDNENIENLNFELMPGGVITGMITGPDDRPLVETIINITRFNSAGNQVPLNEVNRRILITDDRGIYRIYGLPQGRYLVSVGLNMRTGNLMANTTRRSFLKTYYGDTDDESKAKMIEINDGSEITNIDIKVKELKKLYTIRGRIIDKESGLPISGLRLSINTMSKPEDVYRIGLLGISSCCSQSSNEKGEFQFNHLFPGKYVIYHHKDRYVSDSDSQWSTYYSEPTIIEITDSNISEAEVKLVRGGIIRGKLIIEDASIDPSILISKKIRANSFYTQDNLIVQLLNQSGINGDINADGSFILTGLCPGKFHFHIDGLYGDPHFSIERIEFNSKIIYQQRAEAIEVLSGADISGVNLIIKASGTQKLQGEIKVINGKLPDNITLRPLVKKLNEKGRLSGHYGSVDVRGKFTIGDLSEGEYELSLTLNDTGQDDSEEKRRLQRVFDKAKQIITVSTGPPQTIVLTLDLGSKN